MGDTLGQLHGSAPYSYDKDARNDPQFEPNWIMASTPSDFSLLENTQKLRLYYRR